MSYLQVSPDSNLGTKFQSPWFSPLGYTAFQNTLKPQACQEGASLFSAIGDELVESRSDATGKNANLAKDARPFVPSVPWSLSRATARSSPERAARTQPGVKQRATPGNSGTPSGVYHASSARPATLRGFPESSEHPEFPGCLICATRSASLSLLY